MTTHTTHNGRQARVPRRPTTIDCRPAEATVRRLACYGVACAVDRATGDVRVDRADLDHLLDRVGPAEVLEVAA